MVNRILYKETQTQFIQDVEQNLVSQKILYAAKQSGIYSAENEIASWENNAPHISRLLYKAEVKDAYVTFEFLVPFSRKRIDCMIYGEGEDGRQNVIHIELKQWSNNGVKVADSEGNFHTDDVVFNVQAFTGHANRLVAHPSQQVKGYQGYLSNFIEAFSLGEVSLTGFAYCYNYKKNEKNNQLFDSKYNTLIAEYPTFAKDQFDEVTAKLKQFLKKGNGSSVFNKVVESPVRPSKKLLNEVCTLIESGDVSGFSLIEDQIIARNIILDKIRALQKNADHFQKSVIIVKGGPGTGKTVIALHILAELAKLSNKGQGLHVHYATKSKPLLEGVKAQLTPNSRLLFSNVNSFVPASADENSVDVLLVDEAHRIQKSANNQFTPSEKRTNLPMIDTIIRSAKTTVFFIDDQQAIRGSEIGSSKLIREASLRWNAKIEECELTSQFRCNGSDNYLNWLEQVLYNKSIESRFDKNDFDFQIWDDINQMYDALVKQNNKPGQTARLMAGFCWPWSKVVENGDLVKDVCIGSFAMPWETHGDIDKRNLQVKYPQWFEWAYKPEGIKQVGCIYTAQGFEFDYAGVIIGEDLRYDTITKMIVTNKDACKDPTLKKNMQTATMTFDDYVRNIYRVLMSRGMKGCYVYICNPNLREYLKKLQKGMQ